MIVVTDYIARMIKFHPTWSMLTMPCFFFCPLSRGQRLLEEKDATHREDMEIESRAIFQHLQNAVSWNCSLEKARAVSIVTDLFRLPSVWLQIFSFESQKLEFVQDFVCLANNLFETILFVFESHSAPAWDFSKYQWLNQDCPDLLRKNWKTKEWRLFIKWRLTDRYLRWGTLADPRPGRGHADQCKSSEFLHEVRISSFLCFWGVPHLLAREIMMNTRHSQVITKKPEEAEKRSKIKYSLGRTVREAASMINVQARKQTPDQKNKPTARHKSKTTAAHRNMILTRNLKGILSLFFIIHHKRQRSRDLDHFCSRYWIRCQRSRTYFSSRYSISFAFFVMCFFFLRQAG